jgi:hypothetical protein
LVQALEAVEVEKQVAKELLFFEEFEEQLLRELGLEPLQLEDDVSRESLV